MTISLPTLQATGTFLLFKRVSLRACAAAGRLSRRDAAE
jgi:hypothetical protein